MNNRKKSPVCCEFVSDIGIDKVLSIGGTRGDQGWGCSCLLWSYPCLPADPTPG